VGEVRDQQHIAEHDQQHEQQDAQGGEKLAQHHFHAAHRGGFEQLQRAAADFLGVEPHGQHGQQEQQRDADVQKQRLQQHGMHVQLRRLAETAAAQAGYHIKASML